MGRRVGWARRGFAIGRRRITKGWAHTRGVHVAATLAGGVVAERRGFGQRQPLKLPRNRDDLLDEHRLGGVDRMQADHEFATNGGESVGIFAGQQQVPRK